MHYKRYRNESINVSISLIIGTKPKRFDLVRLLLEQNQNVLIWSAYYWNKIGTFQSVPKLFKIESERFSLLQAAQESKQNVSIFKK